jgi:ubiquinone biosynthesis protein
LKVAAFGRYRDVARLLTRYEAGSSDPQRLARDLEGMGPTFVKLGQLLSSRTDVLPAPYAEALARLQDDVAPFAFEDVERIIESELGVRPNKIFRLLEREPVAAASLSQIHRAELRDGRVVAVKVQRPGISAVIERDLEALDRAARFFDRHTRAGRRYAFTEIIDEFRQKIGEELDFEHEALNLIKLADNLAEFDKLAVPAPYEDFTSRRVLTMEFVDGRKITTLSQLSLNELEGAPLAGQLFRAYLKQILVDGFFHADPHPGNVLLRADGRVAILDLGMAGRVGPELQQKLLTLLLALSESRCEDAADAFIATGTTTEGFLEREFREATCAVVLRNADAALSEISLGRIIFEIAGISADCGLRLPRELKLIAKTLLNLDQVLISLDPDFAPAAIVREESTRLMLDRASRRMSRANLSAGFLELENFAVKLPERLGRALDVIGNKEMRIKVDAFDENLLIQGMQKIANRIALGLVLAALIIGATLMMQVPTNFRILEYPGLAILLFGAAAVASVALALDILYYDEKRRARLRAPPSDPPA